MSAKNKILLIFLVVLTFLFQGQGNTLYAQSLSALESEYFDLLNEYQNNVDLLDSTSGKYSRELSKIEEAKNKKNSNESEIAQLMSASVVTSNRIDSLQTAIESVKEIINMRKELLNTIYSERIDSLKKLETNDNYTGNKDLLNVEILSLIEKRLLVRPQISTLSYNPKEIIKITSRAITDSTGNKIIKEYLQSAISEVDKQIEQIHSMTERIDEVISIQQKVDEFVEDAGMQTHLSRFRSSSQYELNARGSKDYYPGEEIGNNIDVANDAINIIPQARIFTMLFDQLSVTDNLAYPNPGKWAERLRNPAGFIPLKDYLSLLNEIETRLSMYKNILEEKLSND